MENTPLTRNQIIGIIGSVLAVALIVGTFAYGLHHSRDATVAADGGAASAASTAFRFSVTSGGEAEEADEADDADAAEETDTADTTHGGSAAKTTTKPRTTAGKTTTKPKTTTAAGGVATTIPDQSGTTAAATTTAKQYLVNFLVQNESGEWTTYKSVYVSYGGTTDPPAAPAVKGKTFSRWAASATNGATFTKATPVTKALNVYGVYTALATYTVKFYMPDGNNDWKLVDTKTGTQGESFELPATPKLSTCPFAGWVEGTPAASTYTLQFDRNKNLYATYNITITFITSGPGVRSSIITNKTIRSGRTTSFPSPPSIAGLKFVKWTLGSPAGKTITSSTQFSNPMDVYAVYEVLPTTTTTTTTTMTTTTTTLPPTED
ncbi:MAG: InlB B-repeat-containing protein [Oscillospiraceae bacterium]|nr:InlB B-repeat-containing protein [Oscillospiraceae bacterium]